MAEPEHLQPLSMDRAAATEAQRQLRAAGRLLAQVVGSRERRRDEAMLDWSGWHRSLNDQAETTLDRAVVQVALLLEETHRSIGNQVAAIDEVNRQRARALVAWREREAERQAAAVASVPAGWSAR